MAGKGSRPRPFSVDMKTFDTNWDNIFKKESKVSEKKGTCGCGRSPTGDCIGWHSLTEDQFKEKKNEWELNEYKKKANELWSDSCTSSRSEQ